MTEKTIHIQARCPHCNREISVHVSVEAKHVRKRGLGAEIWNKVDPLLGTARDSEIAQKFGIGYSMVYLRRKLKGIPKFTDDRSRLYALIDPLLPDHKNVEIFYKLGGKATIGVISKRRQMLGMSLPSYADRAKTREMIFKLHEQGLDYQTIGRAVKLTRQRVEQILREAKPETTP